MFLSPTAIVTFIHRHYNILHYLEFFFFIFRSGIVLGVMSSPGFLSGMLIPNCLARALVSLDGSLMLPVPLFTECRELWDPLKFPPLAPPLTLGRAPPLPWAEVWPRPVPVLDAPPR